MINSSQSLFSAPAPCGDGPPYRELTGLICLVPSRPFSRAPEAIRLAHLCQFWYGLTYGLFEEPHSPASARRPGHLTVPLRSEIRPPYRPRNINRVSIDYAFRPRLRSRLTLGGFPFPRNPWAYGEQDFHLLYRYSSRHIRLLTLHDAFPRRFTAPATLPYHAFASTASAARLFPIIIGARILVQ